MLAQLRVIIACTYIVRYHEASSVTKFSKINFIMKRPLLFSKFYVTIRELCDELSVICLVNIYILLT